MLDQLTGEHIKIANQAVGGPGIGPGNPDGILASYYYYNNIEDQISSVFLQTIKGHVFSDANKRTATALLILLSNQNNLTLPNDDILFDLVVDIASSKYSVEEVSKLLYGNNNET